MDNCIVAVPSERPGGLEARISQHFGHCDLYTVVEVKDGAVKAVSTMENTAHAEGGCLAPVRKLSESGVNVLLAGGMGKRPLAGFNEAGVRVLHTGLSSQVGQAVQAYLAGGLKEFSLDHTCKGHSGCGSSA